MPKEVWVVMGTTGLSVVNPQVFAIDDEDNASKHYLALADHMFKRPEITGPGCDEDVSASVHKVRSLFTDRESGFVPVQDNDEYADYDYYLPDQGGYGMKIRLTIIKESNTAYMVMRGDTADDGDAVFEQEGFVPIEWAKAMTGYEEQPCHQ